MRRTHLLLFLFVSSVLFAQTTQIQEIQFQSVPDPLKLPADLYLGAFCENSAAYAGGIVVCEKDKVSGGLFRSAPAALRGPSASVYNFRNQFDSDLDDRWVLISAALLDRC